MKRSNDSPQPGHNRRAMLRNPHSEFLQSQAVEDFLNGEEPDTKKYRSLERRFVLANEPALLLDLIGVTGESHVMLIGAYDAEARAPITLAKGAEMGRFKLGSTAIVLFGPQQVQWAEGLGANSGVRMGQRLGQPA